MRLRLVLEADTDCMKTNINLSSYAAVRHTVGDLVIAAFLDQEISDKNQLFLAMVSAIEVVSIGPAINCNGETNAH